MKTSLAFSLLSAVVLSACAPTGGAAPEPPATIPEDDQCRATAYQSWIGRNRSDLPSPPSGEVWRVTCSTCAVTMDYNPRRLNIVFDQDSGVIEQVKCG